jgi:hypothetical protein
MHTPLLPKLGILEAGRVRELFQPLDFAESRMMIVLKGEIIQRINAFISEDINKTYQEAIQSVLHLARIEVRESENKDFNYTNQFFSTVGATLPV